MRVLFAAMELYPHVAAGGLADVVAALPGALRAQGADVRLLLPGYPALREAASHLEAAGEVPGLEGTPSRILQGRLPSGLPAYLLDRPDLYPTNDPYEGWDDQPTRFASMAWAAAEVARSGLGGWRPEVLHVHDWPLALAPAYLAFGPDPRPGTLLTIHNLAYQGIYPAEQLEALRLPVAQFTPDGLEYFGQLSFLKAGLRYADRLTTVSPTYAREIQDASRGGLHGLLAARHEAFTGILNGVDHSVWNPAASPHLAYPFDGDRLERRPLNKRALQRELGLREDPGVPLFGLVSRFVPQKGLDLVLACLDRLDALGAQLAILGQGDGELEAGFRKAARSRQGRMALRVGFVAALAHRCFAGSDFILVPSREEPCGLTQLYAQAFGALPLVRRTGGLADTVVDLTPETLRAGTATGFVFDEAEPEALAGALERACGFYRRDPRGWRSVQATAMARDFGWEAPARSYLGIYRELANGKG